MDSTVKKLLGLVVTLGVLIVVVIPLFVVSIIYTKAKDKQKNQEPSLSLSSYQDGLNLPASCKVEDILLDNKVFIVKTDKDCNEFVIGTVTSKKISITNIKKNK